VPGRMEASRGFPRGPGDGDGQVSRIADIFIGVPGQWNRVFALISCQVFPLMNYLRPITR
jgi:hypothetical protein